MNLLARLLSLLIVAIVLAGCQQLKSFSLFTRFTGPAKLRVGIAVDCPPLCYKKDGRILGLEPQMAAGLARFSQKPLELVELPRQELVPALVDGRIDIIMAGLGATVVRGQKLVATDPYFISGQGALVHLDDHQQLGNSADNLKQAGIRLGVVAGSGGEQFLKGLKPQGRTTRFVTAPEAVQALIDDTIDVLVHDQVSNFYYAALYVDQGLTPGTTPLTREPLVWAVRSGNQAMVKAANDYLAAIEDSNELQTLIEGAIPLYRTSAYRTKQFPFSPAPK